MLGTNQQRASTVIVGLGKTGLSCARYFKCQGKEFRVVDSRDNPPCLDELKNLDASVDVTLGNISASSLAGAKELVMSPGVDPRLPAIASLKHEVKITGDVDIFAHAIEAPLLAVTGSNAKSTVVTLLGAMAQQSGENVAVAGNIGTPVLDCLQSKEKSMYVLELSSFQLESTHELNADVAAILNISMDHMDRYDSMEEYLSAKQRIFQGCKHLVFNREDALTKPLPDFEGDVSSFGLDEPSEGQFGCKEIDGLQWLVFGSTPLLLASEMKIPGRHNVSNALAALAMGKAAGFEFANMIQALRSFTGLPHRCQWVGSVNEVNFYNDSKGTNTGACIAALQGLAEKGEIVLMVGGQSKGADLSVLRDTIEAYAKHVVVYGEDADLFKDALKGVVSLSSGKTFKKAFKKAVANTEPGNVVLLSPACASFDMFKNYEERGNTFVELVRGLQA